MGVRSRCQLCGHEVACLDEQDRCEQCVLRAERLAADLLPAMEQFVRAALESGLTENQLLEAFELCLLNDEGELSELSVSRNPACTGAWTRESTATTRTLRPQHAPHADPGNFGQSASARDRHHRHAAGACRFYVRTATREAPGTWG